MQARRVACSRIRQTLPFQITTWSIVGIDIKKISNPPLLPIYLPNPDIFNPGLSHILESSKIYFVVKISSSKT